MIKTKKRKRMPSKMPEKKLDGFAIGVSQAHYWVITTLAVAHGTNRTLELERIIDYYIQNVIAKQ